MTESTPAPTGAVGHQIRRLTVGMTIVGSVVIGLLLIVVAATLGSCDAFGGSCPADPPPPLDDDVFGMAAFGAALIVIVPTFLRRPSWQRLGIAVGSGVATALIVGLLVRSGPHG